MANPIRVALAEHDQLVREGVRRLLGDHDDLVLVGQVDRGDHLFPLLDGTRPDVLVISGHLPQNFQLPLGLFGVVKATQQMAESHPETAVILVAQHYVPLLAEALDVEQVRGFLFREDKLALQLPAAVRVVHEGGSFLSETASQELFHPSDWGEVGGLNEHQVAVLSLLTAMPEATRDKYARCLGVTAATFDYHLKQLCRVLRARNRLSAVLRALKAGILRLEDL